MKAIKVILTDVGLGTGLAGVADLGISEEGVTFSGSPETSMPGLLSIRV